MNIRTWQVKDIYFNESEREQVDKHIEKLKLSGWWIREEDTSTGIDEYEFCTQLHKDG